MSDLDLVIQMMGGLGNQLFQYAIGRRLQLDRKANVRFDLGSYDQFNSRAINVRKYRATVAETTATDRLTMRLSFGKTFEKITSKFGPIGRPFLWQRHFDYYKGYDAKLLQLTGRWYLSGWWQSPKYFESIRETILDEYQPRDPLAKIDAEMEKQIAGVNAVSVHVRRGDMLTHPVYSKQFKVQTAEYYRDCMREMEDRLDHPTFFIFSDDPKWARENIPGNAVFVDNHDGSADFIDLWLMSRCKHFITANSTFSWWAAWMSRNVNKIVIVPSIWRYEMNGPPPDLVPADWQIGPKVSTEIESSTEAACSPSQHGRPAHV